MIAPDRLKLRTTVMSIGAATEVAGGFQQENRRSNTSLRVLTCVPGSAGVAAGPRVIGWLGCGLAGRLGEGACARAAGTDRSKAADSVRIDIFVLSAIANSLIATSCRRRPGPSASCPGR